MAKAVSFGIRVAPMASVFMFGAPAGLLPKFATFFGCMVWAGFAEAFLEAAAGEHITEKLYGRERLGASDAMFTYGADNPTRCMKLGALPDG